MDNLWKDDFEELRDCGFSKTKAESIIDEYFQPKEKTDLMKFRLNYRKPQDILEAKPKDNPEKKGYVISGLSNISRNHTYRHELEQMKKTYQNLGLLIERCFDDQNSKLSGFTWVNPEKR